MKKFLSVKGKVVKGRTAKHEITAPKEERLCSTCRPSLSPTSTFQPWEAGGQQSHPAAPVLPGDTGNEGSTAKMQSLVPVPLPHAQDVRCPRCSCTGRSDCKGRSKARCKVYNGRNMTQFLNEMKVR